MKPISQITLTALDPISSSNPTSHRSYSLVHDLTNAGGLTYETLENSKFRGGVISRWRIMVSNQSS